MFFQITKGKNILLGYDTEWCPLIVCDVPALVIEKTPQTKATITNAPPTQAFVATEALFSITTPPKAEPRAIPTWSAEKLKLC